MKRLIIATVQAPFIWGGAEILAEDLQSQLRKRGHLVDIIKLPFKWYPAEILPSQIMMARLVDVTFASGLEVDQVIGLKFPAYCIPHPNKVLWILHQHRSAYDLWGTEYQDIPDSPEGRRIRDIIRQVDNRYIPESKKIFTNSKIVASRLEKYNNITAEPLYPPLNKPELYHRDRFDSFLFYPSRLNEIKRQAMAVEAMKFVKSDIKLILAGKADNLSYQMQLEKMIEANGLQEKVIMLGEISEKEKVDLYSRALAVLYLPYKEDSYGYVTLESFQSKKPVITFKDSGGVDELVEDKVNGMILSPESRVLGEAIEWLVANKHKAKIYGDNAFEKIQRLNISWDHVVDSLVL